MTPERWQQIDGLLQDALAQPPAVRAAFLNRACGQDDELRRQVEALLRSHEEAGDFLEAPPAELADELLMGGEAEPAAGRLIGPYRIERQIGRGGMGVVFVARDTRLGRPVAVKLLQAKFTQDSARVRRFQQEARAASALNHPNILTIHEIGEAKGEHYIATEFVDGQTLRAQFNSGGMPLGAALELLIQVAAALAAAHEAGIIHRDIKPENIMLRRDGLAKVLDFGLAKLIEQAVPPSESFARVTTQPGVVMGTISYMSPEQARGLEMGPQTDLFSLGVVMYELLAGHTPFEGETTSDVLVALLNGEPRPLNRYLPLLPDAFQEIVSRALAKPVEQRYQTAQELAGDLKRVKEELEFAAKLKGPLSESAALLALKVGASSSTADRTTFKTAAPAGRTTSRLTKLRGYWRRRGKVLAAAVAIALVIAGAVWGKSWWASRGSAPATPTTPATIDSVAVLPFANVGGDSQTEYLPDGITEGLIDNLSQLPGLTVMARGTVFTYKGREVDPRQVGQALSVRAVVTGRVERRGERLIVRAEMADAASGAQLWGGQFDRPAAELLSVHQEITREISEALRGRLSNAQQQQLARRYAANSEAYHLYLRGRFLLSQGSRPSYEKALDLFHQALALDQNYALAYAGIADFYSATSAQYMPPSEAMPKARQAAQTALRLDEALPEAHVSMAIIANWADWNWAESEREYQRALALNPNLTSARASHTGLLTQLGRFEEAMREARRAEQLDPLSPHSLLTVANTLYFARQYDQAIAQLQKLIEVVPSFGGPYRLKGQTLSLMGKHQEAISELRQAVRLNPQDTHRAWLAYGCARAGQRDEAIRILRELKEKAAKEHVSPTYLARIYIALGEKDQAFAWLRKAYDERSDHILTLGVDPIYDPLRSDPRYVQLLRDIGLPAPTLK